MKQPVRDIELLKTFATAVVVWLVVMGYWAMTDVQQAVTLTMLMAGINLAGAWWQNRETTPLAEPRDTDGEILSRPNELLANKELSALKTEAEAMDKEITDKKIAEGMHP